MWCLQMCFPQTEVTRLACASCFCEESAPRRILASSSFCAMVLMNPLPKFVHAAWRGFIRWVRRSARLPYAPGACIAGAEVTGRVVGGALLDGGCLHLTLPGACC